jgi:ribosomal protein L9
MQIVLTGDVPNLGTRHDVVSVTAGFARNYLFTHNLAVLATPAVIDAAKSASRFEPPA